VLLGGQGFSTQEAVAPEQLLAAVQEGGFDVVLMDLNYTRGSTSGTEGLSLLEKLLEHDPTLAVVVMTAWSNVDLAVDATDADPPARDQQLLGSDPFVGQQFAWDCGAVVRNDGRQARPARRFTSHRGTERELESIYGGGFPVDAAA